MLSSSLRQNLQQLQQDFSDCADYLVRRLQVAGTEAALLTIDGLVNKQQVAISVLNPLLNSRVTGLTATDKMENICRTVLATTEQVPVRSREELTEKLMGGFAVLLLEGCPYGVGFGLQGFAVRSLEEPEDETMLYGARDGFVESFQTNMMLIRRRMHTPDCKFHPMTVGTQSKTQVLVCYLQSAVSPEILQMVLDRLTHAQIQHLLATEYLIPTLSRNGIFTDVTFTARPDAVCGKIAEGRIAVIVDGCASVAVVPHLFIENFHTVDDYATRPYYAAVTRILKYGAFFISMFLPGLYVAVCGFHPEMLPDTLLLKIAKASASTPFPIMTESLLAYFMYDVMREAGMRAPKPLSNAVSIVGALVIGDMAVSAGILSEVTLVVIAITAVSGYALPKLYQQTSVCSLVFIVIGGTMGVWGMVLSFLFVLFNICSRYSYGIPLTSGLSPFSFRAVRDMFLRFSWTKLGKTAARVQHMPGAQKEKEQEGDRHDGFIRR